MRLTLGYCISYISIFYNALFCIFTFRSRTDHGRTKSSPGRGAVADPSVATTLATENEARPKEEGNIVHYHMQKF